jgi:hypothetical protein
MGGSGGEELRVAMVLEIGPRPPVQVHQTPRSCRAARPAIVTRTNRPPTCRARKAVNNLADRAANIRQLRADHPEWTIATLASRAMAPVSYVEEVLNAEPKPQEGSHAATESATR